LTTMSPRRSARRRTPNARYVEFFRDDQVLNFRRLIDRQLEHRNGHVLLHQTPGLGFNFDEKMIKRYGNWLEIR
jgi:L-alanine-DL-glutamate epimerase-like enolase superfamily enzyme